MKTTILAITVVLLLGAPASAHPAPRSELELDVRDHSIAAELRLPAEDFSLASGVDVTGAAADLGDRQSALTSYLSAHLHATTSSGAAWRVRVGKFTSTGTGILVAHAVITPPAGAGVRRFTLDYDAIVHQVTTDLVVVSVRQDWAGGRIERKSEQLGIIRTDPRSMTVAPLPVDLGGAGSWRGFVAAMAFGARFVLLGWYHLFLLLALLTSAALVLVRSRRIRATLLLGEAIAPAVSALTRLDVSGHPVAAFLGLVLGAVPVPLILATLGIAAVRLTRPRRTAQPAEATEPAAVTKPAEVAAVTESAQRAEPVHSAGRAQPAEPVHPGARVHPAEPAEAAQVSQLTAPELTPAPSSAAVPTP